MNKFIYHCLYCHSNFVTAEEKCPECGSKNIRQTNIAIKKWRRISDDEREAALWEWEKSLPHHVTRPLDVNYAVTTETDNETDHSDTILDLMADRILQKDEAKAKFKNKKQLRLLLIFFGFFAFVAVMLLVVMLFNIL